MLLEPKLSGLLINSIFAPLKNLKTLSKIALLFLLISIVGCSDFKKLQKSNDFEKKYEAAVKYYENGDYLKASILLEELITLYRGTTKAEKIYYYYAHTTYEAGDYILAGFHFKTFVRSYPNSVHAEECAYMVAYCHYLNSPAYSLDQTDTHKAINEFQLFVNQYPKSEKVAEANKMIDHLRGKLERKSYDIAKQYYFIGEYKAANVAFANILKDFPDTKRKDEINFLILKSNYLLAVNSIESKKGERIQATLDSYAKFAEAFPQSEYLKDAESIKESALKLQEKLKTKSS